MSHQDNTSLAVDLPPVDVSVLKELRSPRPALIRTLDDYGRDSVYRVPPEPPDDDHDHDPEPGGPEPLPVFGSDGLAVRL
jgi:hypothetical protein